jgi:hypothetical protein
MGNQIRSLTVKESMYSDMREKRPMPFSVKIPELHSRIQDTV